MNNKEREKLKAEISEAVKTWAAALGRVPFKGTGDFLAGNVLHEGHVVG